MFLCYTQVEEKHTSLLLWVGLQLKSLFLFRCNVRKSNLTRLIIEVTVDFWYLTISVLDFNHVLFIISIYTPYNVSEILVCDITDSEYLTCCCLSWTGIIWRCETRPSPVNPPKLYLRAETCLPAGSWSQAEVDAAGLRKECDALCVQARVPSWFVLV